MTDAEVARLDHEMVRLAQKNRWTGVERSYQRLMTGGGDPAERTHVLAADAARHMGDIQTALERLAEADPVGESPTIAPLIEGILSSFGQVQLVAGKAAMLHPHMPPFRPDAMAAIDFARDGLARGAFEGFLPAGHYNLDGMEFEVQPGMDVVVVGADERDIRIAGVHFPPRVTLGGQKLLLNGVGLRSKFTVNVYVGALYLPEQCIDGPCVLEGDGPKKMVMHFVYRKVTQKQIVEQFRESLSSAPGVDKIGDQLEAFFSSIPDMLHGDRFVFEYVPDKGTTVRASGGERLHFEGGRLMDALLYVFVGEPPASVALRDGLLSGMDLP
jgi:hypothetical protein